MYFIFNFIFRLKKKIFFNAFWPFIFSFYIIYFFLSFFFFSYFSFIYLFFFIFFVYIYILFLLRFAVCLCLFLFFSSGLSFSSSTFCSSLVFSFFFIFLHFCLFLFLPFFFLTFSFLLFSIIIQLFSCYCTTLLAVLFCQEARLAREARARASSPMTKRSRRNNFLAASLPGVRVSLVLCNLVGHVLVHYASGGSWYCSFLSFLLL